MPQPNARAAAPPSYAVLHQRTHAWQPLPQRKKNYAPDAFTGSFCGSSRRKTRESVQPIRGAGMFDGRVERLATPHARRRRIRFAAWRSERDGVLRQPPRVAKSREELPSAAMRCA